MIKKFFSFLFPVSVLMVFGLFLSCSVPTEPKALAEAFIKSMQSRDFRAAKTMVDEPSKAKINSVASIAGELPKEEQAIITGFIEGNLSIKNAEITDTTAKVEFTINDGNSDFLYLVKEDGAWKVRFQAQRIYP